MGVADRVRRRQLSKPQVLTEGSSHPGTAVQSIPVPAEYAAIVRLRTLGTFIGRNPDQGVGPIKGELARFLFTTVLDEISDELTDIADEEQIALFMRYMGDVIAWVGHGDDSLLPDMVRTVLYETLDSPSVIVRGEIEHPGTVTADS